MRKNSRAHFLILFLWAFLLTGIGTVVAAPHGACGTCHLPVARAASDAPRGAGGAAAICARCHMATAEGEAHSPVVGGHAQGDHPRDPVVPPLGRAEVKQVDCLSCHSPHPNGQPHQLLEVRLSGVRGDFDPETRLCLSCHPLAADFRGSGGHFTRHPVGRDVAARVQPVRLEAADLSAPAPEGVSCATCHRAHEERNPFLLRWAMKDQISACAACHADVAAGLR
ncbi:MAG: hypothetical protein HY049_13900 [Acidobacteria bacterium]|nr:hypothetical protein [Acidobacteriota bacterium]